MLDPILDAIPYLIGGAVCALAASAPFFLWCWLVVTKERDKLAIINGNLSILLEAEKAETKTMRAALQRKISPKLSLVRR